MELVLAGVFGSQVGGRAAEVAGEKGHVADIGFDGLGGVVTQLQVFDHPLPQGSHGGHRQSEDGNRETRSVSILTAHPTSAPDRIIAATGTTGPRARGGPLSNAGWD